MYNPAGEVNEAVELNAKHKRGRPTKVKQQMNNNHTETRIRRTSMNLTEGGTTEGTPQM